METCIDVLAVVAAFAAAAFSYQGASSKLAARAALFAGISTLLVWIKLAVFHELL